MRITCRKTKFPFASLFFQSRVREVIEYEDLHEEQRVQPQSLKIVSANKYSTQNSENEVIIHHFVNFQMLLLFNPSTRLLFVCFVLIFFSFIINSSIHLLTYSLTLSMYSSIRSFVYLFIYSGFDFYAAMLHASSCCLSACLSVCLTVCLYALLSVCPQNGYSSHSSKSTIDSHTALDHCKYEVNTWTPQLNEV